MVHKHSLEARKKMIASSEKKKRAQLVFETYWFHGPQSDRDVLNRLKPGSDNINYVQPRCTELLDDDVLEVVGHKKEFGNTVRVCNVRHRVEPELQTSLL